LIAICFKKKKKEKREKKTLGEQQKNESLKIKKLRKREKSLQN